MKRFPLFFLFIYFCCQLCLSQVNFGLKAGVNIPSTEIDFQNINIENIKKSPSLGYLGGVFLDINFTKIGLLTEILYTDSKGNIEFDLNNNNFTTEHIIKKLDVPVLVKYNLLSKFLSINAGPMLKFNLNEEFINLPTFDINTVFNNQISLGYQLGVRAKIVNFAIEIRYESSFGNKTSEILVKEINNATNLNIGDKLFKIKHPNLLSFAVAFDIF